MKTAKKSFTNQKSHGIKCFESLNQKITPNWNDLSLSRSYVVYNYLFCVRLKKITKATIGDRFRFKVAVLVFYYVLKFKS